MSEAAELKSVKGNGLPENEREAVNLAVCGDTVAFRWIYDRYLRLVSGTVARVLGYNSDIEDVVQEVFVKVHKSLSGFRGDCRLGTWLYRISFRVAVSHLRSQEQLVPLEDWRMLRSELRIFERLEARERIRALYAALSKVPPESKEAFLLYETEGMKLREIAELTGEPLNTVTTRVHRTREHLREVLTAIGQEKENV